MRIPINAIQVESPSPGHRRGFVQEPAVVATVVSESSCSCGQPLECCHADHCPRCGIVPRARRTRIESSLNSSDDREPPSGANQEAAT